MSRRKSLRDIFVAKVTTNNATTYAAAAPIKLARALSAKVDIKRESEPLYSDDSVEEILSSLTGIDIEINVNDLSPEQEALLTGATYDKGYLIDNKDDIASEIAIGWRAKRTDNKWEMVWLYCGKFSQGTTDNYETQADKVATQTPVLKGTFYAREKDGNFRVRVNETYLEETFTDAKQAITTWFSEVQEPVAA
ncbi:hypothetical protein D3C76_1310350 [compost metagenome]